MKLLFDQNLSYRLTQLLSKPYPDSRHVKDFGLTMADDDVVWKLAAEQNYVIVSKDVDFLSRSLLYGHPPKVIYLRVGNCSTETIKVLLLKQEVLISQFIDDPMESTLVLR